MYKTKWWLSLLCFAVGATHAAEIRVEVQSATGEPLENAVVFLKSERLNNQLKPLSNIEMAQMHRAFVPGVLVITQGTAVDFPNRDTVRHHVYSFSPAKTFELKLYIDKPEQPVIFDQAGVVELGCNIHDNMLAWILVSETPVYAHTNKQGEAIFRDQMPENYEIDVWHASLPYGLPFVTSSVTVDAQPISVRIAMPDSGERL
ncbi:methylamine utilization protein [Vibrio navarrensis]|uniref:methylamine utilization protein n=1 Tax=Vibrio navarrensis TaxID=29495 RepID=UPI001866B5CF|nr:methylamine utilization protein [Vibrio navarrensis]MBE3664522.1 methylamine utilization protein [Vibrio navarrensis]